MILHEQNSFFLISLHKIQAISSMCTKYKRKDCMPKMQLMLCSGIKFYLGRQLHEIMHVYEQFNRTKENSILNTGY